MEGIPRVTLIGLALLAVVSVPLAPADTSSASNSPQALPVSSGCLEQPCVCACLSEKGGFLRCYRYQGRPNLHMACMHEQRRFLRECMRRCSQTTPASCPD